MNNVNIKGRRKKPKSPSLPALIAVLILLAMLLTAWTIGTNWNKYAYPTEHFELIQSECEVAEIDPYLVCAIIKAESGFDETAISPVGAIGLMQVMPDTAVWILEKNNVHNDEIVNLDLQNPEENITIGIKYLDFLLDYWQGDLEIAVASYNAGQNKVSEWINNETWDGTLENVEDIPYSETRNYVAKVFKYYEKYLEEYAEA